MLASVTRLRVRSLLHLPAFFWTALLVARQAKRAPGFVGGGLLIDNLRTYWTLTVWEDEKSMKAFRGLGAHGRAMPKLLHWCDEASYARWTCADERVPQWREAYDHLLREGRLSRVERPSADHEARRFPEPRLHIGTKLTPAGTNKKLAA
jgi:Domain of unknown function (DUF3291)